jgi:hypothetical protein
MHTSSLLGLDQFWTIVRHLESLEDQTTLEDFKRNFKIHAADKIVLDVISFLKKFDYHIKVITETDFVLISPAVDKAEVEIPFGFTDWLALQSCLINKDNDKPFDLLREKIKGWNEDNKSWDLFKTLELELVEDPSSDGEECKRKAVINKLEKIMEDNDLARLSFQDGKVYEAYIHKLIILDGHLSVIAEEVVDRCLISFFVSDVDEVRQCPDHSYKPNYTSFQLEEFIAGMRAVIDNEERLVLKVFNPEKVNLNPPYHFLGSPYITSNANGDYIWAASVEVSNELFSWLKEIKDDVEIIDPEPIKRQFENYLEIDTRVLKKGFLVSYTCLCE